MNENVKQFEYNLQNIFVLVALKFFCSTHLSPPTCPVQMRLPNMKWFEPGDNSQDITKPQNPSCVCYSPFITYRLHLAQISCFQTPLTTSTHTFSENFKMRLLVGNVSGSLDTRSNRCYFTGVTLVIQKTYKLFFPASSSTSNFESKAYKA